MGVDRNRRRCQRIGNSRSALLATRERHRRARDGSSMSPKSSSSETSFDRGFGDAHLGRVIVLFARDGRARDGPQPLRLAVGGRTLRRDGSMDSGILMPGRELRAVRGTGSASGTDHPSSNQIGSSTRALSTTDPRKLDRGRRNRPRSRSAHRTVGCRGNRDLRIDRWEHGWF